MSVHPDADKIDWFNGDSHPLIVSIFSNPPDPAFICGFQGTWNLNFIEEIQGQIDEEGEDFLRDKAPGSYLFEAKFIPPQIDGVGRTEYEGYWEFKQIDFKPIPLQNCPHCWGYGVKLQYTDENCPECYGTGKIQPEEK